MDTPLLYVYASVSVVSLLALVGVATLRIEPDRLRRVVRYLVSFAAGTLFGDTFLHILPETVENHGFDATTGLYVLFGIVLAFVVETYLSWQHRHDPHPDVGLDDLSSMVLFGDGVHNVLDGMIIAASYLTSVPVGIATTVAIAFHEIPQELGNFGVLVYGGTSRSRALLYNFLTALTAFAGATVVVLATDLTWVVPLLLPVAAGNFVYIAGSDLLPELIEESDPYRATLQMLTFLFGIGLMYALTW